MHLKKYINFAYIYKFCFFIEVGAYYIKKYIKKIIRSKIYTMLYYIIYFIHM